MLPVVQRETEREIVVYSLATVDGLFPIDCHSDGLLPAACYPRRVVCLSVGEFYALISVH